MLDEMDGGNCIQAAPAAARDPQTLQSLGENSKSSREALEQGRFGFPSPPVVSKTSSLFQETPTSRIINNHAQGGKGPLAPSASPGKGRGQGHSQDTQRHRREKLWGDYGLCKGAFVCFSNLSHRFGGLRALLQFQVYSSAQPQAPSPQESPEAPASGGQEEEAAILAVTSGTRDQNLPLLREPQLNPQQLPGTMTSANPLPQDFNCTYLLSLIFLSFSEPFTLR